MAKLYERLPCASSADDIDALLPWNIHLTDCIACRSRQDLTAALTPSFVDRFLISRIHHANVFESSKQASLSRLVADVQRVVQSTLTTLFTYAYSEKILLTGACRSRYVLHHHMVWSSTLRISNGECHERSKFDCTWRHH